MTTCAEDTAAMRPANSAENCMMAMLKRFYECDERVEERAMLSLGMSRFRGLELEPHNLYGWDSIEHELSGCAFYNFLPKRRFFGEMIFLAPVSSWSLGILNGLTAGEYGIGQRTTSSRGGGLL